MTRDGVGQRREPLGELDLLGSIEHDRRRARRCVPARLTQDRAHAGVRVLQVRRGVAAEAQHLVVGEDVVALPVLTEVGVLHRADADDVRDVLHVVRERQIAFLRPRDDERASAVDRLLQQLGELRVVARPCPQTLAVLPEHEPEADVLDALVGDPPGHAPDREHHLEVLALAAVDDVEDTVGAEVLRAVTECREIGRAVARSRRAGSRR